MTSFNVAVGQLLTGRSSHSETLSILLRKTFIFEKKVVNLTFNSHKRNLQIPVNTHTTDFPKQGLGGGAALTSPSLMFDGFLFVFFFFRATGSETESFINISDQADL